MPERSIRIHQTDRPWMTSNLKRLIRAFVNGNITYKLLRNKVNREKKHCSKIYYNNKVKDLQQTKPRDWWREVKQLSGSTKTYRPNLRSIIKNEDNLTDPELANKINKAFISVMNDKMPLSEHVVVSIGDDEPIIVTEESVALKLRQISANKASGPDYIPNWVLKEYADILATKLSNLRQTPHLHSKRLFFPTKISATEECRVPSAWKMADVPPVPKAPTVEDFNKDLRPISLTSTLSKVAESYVIERDLKPTLLRSLVPSQFGFIPGSSTTIALISMLHKWLEATDGMGATVRIALLDFKKVFELVDHNLIISKLFSLGIKPSVVNWIADFLRERFQIVKINFNLECYSSFMSVPAGIPQAQKLAHGSFWQ